MQRKRYEYLIELQYLGFRYHGWQKQPEVLTLQRMLERTLSYVLKDQKYKVIAAGRTDAKVSVNQTYVELFVFDTPLEQEVFFQLLNENLPPDIRALSIEKINANFNLIQHPKIKEYLYLFSFGEKFHPFCAPFMINIASELDLEQMKKGAKLFEGGHDFWSYAFRPSENTQTKGRITHCEIMENTKYSANFFPRKNYMLRVRGEGFKRHQIRLMMGALIDLGKGKIDLDFIRKTLDATQRIKLEHIAPASGLILNRVDFKENKS